MINFIKAKRGNIVQKGKRAELIRNAVKRIPYGKVATFGQIAQMAGVKDARVVGRALSGVKYSL